MLTIRRRQMEELADRQVENFIIGLEARWPGTPVRESVQLALANGISLQKDVTRFVELRAGNPDAVDQSLASEWGRGVMSDPELGSHARLQFVHLQVTGRKWEGSDV